MNNGERTMRAWRTHEYGRPTEVLQLDTVPVPTPEAGEVRVRVQAIPFNLNDLERITGGNMMVRPELPYSPGMEVMGIVDACGDGHRGVAGPPRRRDAEGRERRLRRVRDLPGGVDVRHARVDPAARRGRALLPVPSRVARPVRPRRAAGRRECAHPRRRRRLGIGRGPTREARRRARVRDRRHRREGAAVPRPRRRRRDQLQRGRLRARSCSPRPANKGVDVVFDNVGEAVMEKSMQCTVYNGRYLMMGFASNKVVADEPFIVPAPDRARELQVVRRVARVSGAGDGGDAQDRNGLELRDRPSSARRSCARSSTSSSPGKIKPIVGRTIDFDDIPAEIEAMANRETIGRTIVMLES